MTRSAADSRARCTLRLSEAGTDRHDLMGGLSRPLSETLTAGWTRILHLDATGDRVRGVVDMVQPGELCA